MPDKKQSEFTVTDRRRFTSEGETAPEPPRPLNEAGRNLLATSEEWKDINPEFLNLLTERLGNPDNTAQFVRVCSEHRQMRDKIRGWEWKIGEKPDTAAIELILYSISELIDSFGRRMAEKNSLEDAKHAFALSLAFNPDNPLAMYGMAKVLGIDGDKAAVNWAERFLSFKPDESLNALAGEGWKQSEADKSGRAALESMRAEMALIRGSLEPAQQPPKQEEGNVPPPPSAADRQAQHDAFKETSKKLDAQIQSELGGRRVHDFEMNFERFIASLYMSALMQLGLMQEQGGQAAVDLLGARQTIDTLGMLADKTKGNLTMMEDNLMQNVLYELRMAYVEVTNAIASGPQTPGAPPPPGGLNIK